MFRKIVSIFLLLITLASFAPVASAQSDQITISDECGAAGQSFAADIGGFVVRNILWGAGFMAVDMLTSFLETLTIFGFNVGGIFEPFDQAMNFMRDIWMKSLIWGSIASIFNWLAGSLIEAGLVLNLTLTADNPLINYGGKIILQIANFGFVISIIFVGIATILRLKKDELSANKLLFKLIIGIILVNLTIPIATAIADLGTKITMAMYKASSPCPENITRQFTANNLQTLFKELLSVQVSETGSSIRECTAEEVNNSCGNTQNAPGCIECIPAGEFNVGDSEEGEDSGLSDDERRRLNEQAEKTSSQASAFTGLVGGLTLDFLSMVAGAVVSLIAALTFLIFAVFLLVRFVILMLLLTFSPLIWFGFIFKDLKLGKGGNIWSAWWGQFLKWTFFGPVIILFLAFVSEYLNSISAAPLVVSAYAELVQIGQLISVIIIAAMGIFLAVKFSGVAGGLAIAAATGGLGFIAGKTQGLLKRGQIGSQMRVEQLKAQGKGSSLQARALNLSSKGFGRAATGAGLGGGASALLKQVGIKPNVQVPTDDEIRKGVIEKRMTRPVGGGTKKAMFSTSGKIFGKEVSLQGGVKETPENALSLTQNDIKNLSEDGKKEATAAIRKVQDQYIKDKKSLQPKQIIALRKLEKSMSAELTDHIVDNLKSLANPETALGLSNANLASISKEGNVAEKAEIDDAIVQLGLSFPTLTPDQQTEYARLKAKRDLLDSKGEW